MGQLASGPGEPSGGARKFKSKRGCPRDRNPNFGGNPTPSVIGEGEGVATVVAAVAEIVPCVAVSEALPKPSSVAEGSCSSAIKLDSDTVMLFAQTDTISPISKERNVVIPQSLTTSQAFEKVEATTPRSEKAGGSVGSPSPFLSFDKVTTRKRDRGEADARVGLFQNLNAAFSLESPRPFKQILRQTSGLGSGSHTRAASVTVTSSDGVDENPFIQHTRLGLSPSSSERSSPPGEPAGSA